VLHFGLLFHENIWPPCRHRWINQFIFRPGGEVGVGLGRQLADVDDRAGQEPPEDPLELQAEGVVFVNRAEFTDLCEKKYFLSPNLPAIS
jgi:hypothetical protein